jgi:hypothetical protein
MDVIHPAPSTQHQINDFDAIKIQLALFVIAGSLQQTQQSPVYLPEVFAGNEEGRRSMTKAELEMFIDYRGLSRCDYLEQQVETLKRWVSELEKS